MTTLATIGFLFVLVVIAETATLYVEEGGTGLSCNRGDECGSIQEAVVRASAGDMIQVGPGTFEENINIPTGRDGLVLVGRGTRRTTIRSPGGIDGREEPVGVPIDVGVDISSPAVLISDFTIEHPEGPPLKRDIGIFVRPPAADVLIVGVKVQRLRTGNNLEPTMPGSRGLLVLQATGVASFTSWYYGNYQDHISLPTSNATMTRNEIYGATRIGIVVIQETGTSVSADNSIYQNHIEFSGTDGIQIQGDCNEIRRNHVVQSGRVGILLCGAGSAPFCVPPGVNAIATDNIVAMNRVRDSTGRDIVDNGNNNTVHFGQMNKIGMKKSTKKGKLGTEWPNIHESQAKSKKMKGTRMMSMKMKSKKMKMKGTKKTMSMKSKKMMKGSMKTTKAKKKSRGLRRHF